MENEKRLIDANALAKVAEKRCGVINIKHIYEYEKWWDCFYIQPVNVTHWMPFPEPPEGE